MEYGSLLGRACCNLMPFGTPVPRKLTIQVTVTDNGFPDDGVLEGDDSCCNDEMEFFLPARKI